MDKEPFTFTLGIPSAPSFGKSFTFGESFTFGKSFTFGRHLHVFHASIVVVVDVVVPLV